MLRADVDPADQEQHPSEAEEGDEGRVERDEEAKGLLHVLAKGLHGALELGPPRMEHVADVIVELGHLLHGPAVQRHALREDGVVEVELVIPILDVGTLLEPIARRCSGRCCPRIAPPRSASQIIRRMPVNEAAQGGYEEGVLDVGDIVESRDFGVWMTQSGIC